MRAKCLFFVFILANVIFPLRVESQEQSIDIKTTKQNLKLVTGANILSESKEISRKLQLDVNTPLPGISFESTVQDLGELGVGEKKKCEFKFKNIGQSLLKIERIKVACACSHSGMSKKEYKPGEEGVIKITYNGQRKLGFVKSHIFVKTNDTENSTVKLTMNAKVVQYVEAVPKILELSLNQENAGIPSVLLKSRDKKLFSVKAFIVNNNVIKAEFDPNATAREFVLKPVVDMQKLKKYRRGKIKIKVSHPKCKLITLSYEIPPKFQIKPRNIILHNPEPNKPQQRQILIKSRDEKLIGIESITSEKCDVKILSQLHGNNQITLKLEITPPTKKVKPTHFRDSIIIKMKDGEKITIYCIGLYKSRDNKD